MEEVCLIVNQNGKSLRLKIPAGSNLRTVLLENGISPYGKISRHLNCGGRGLCATCGVYFIENEPLPQQWHDRIGSRFGYPRLSCQITLREDAAIEIIGDKKIWGKRKK